MKSNCGKLVPAGLLAAACLLGAGLFLGPSPRVHAADDATAPASPPAADSTRRHLPATVEEARGRALLLHETIHGSLQVMHRDFFDAEESRKIPSHSLEDVFVELNRSYGVRVRWLAVNAKAMNVDNEPQDDFERKAVTALAAGEERFEETTPQAYRYAGAIALSAECLSCHLPARSNNDARVAGLVISMPLAKRPQ